MTRSGSGCALNTFRVFQAGLDQLDKLGRRKGFGAEYYVQTLILVFGFRQPAQHDHGQPIAEHADLPHQLRAVAAGHDVISHDHANAIRKPSQSSQGTFGSGGDGNLKACVPQNRFPDGQLQRVIVYEKNLPQAVLCPCLLFRTA